VSSADDKVGGSIRVWRGFFLTGFIQVLPALMNVLPLVSGAEIKGNRSLAKVTSPYSK